MTSLVDINPDHLKIVQSILRDNLPDSVAVWAFGSRADWTTKDTSDLDLALEGDSTLDHGTIDALKIAFEESSLPYKVDIIDLNQVSDKFKRIVDAQKVVFSVTEDMCNTDNWHMASLGDIVDLRISSVDKKTKNGEQPVWLCNYTDVYNNSFINADMDFMTATATKREIFKCRLSDSDVIITKDSEKYDDIGVPALVREDISNLVCGHHLAILRPTPKIDGTYLYYALNTDGARHQFQSYANGVTRFGLRKADINLVEIPLPTLNEQRGMAHILRTLDDKIALNLRMNRTLEAMARTLFKSWFVDFDPVRAKMGGRWRRGKSLPGLPAHLYDLFPDSMVDSDLGEMPEGWKVKALAEFATVVYGAAFAAKCFNDSGKGLPLIRIRDLSNQNPSVFTDEKHPKGQLIQPGDIVVGMDGEFRAHIWKGPTSWLNQRVCHFQPSQGVPHQFLFEALIEPLAGFERSKVGTTVIQLGKADIDSIRLARPPVKVFDVFASCTDPMIRRAVINAAESRLLATQRDALLPKLVSGEFRVKTEKSMENELV